MANIRHTTRNSWVAISETTGSAKLVHTAIAESVSIQFTDDFTQNY